MVLIVPPDPDIFLDQVAHSPCPDLPLQAGASQEAAAVAGAGDPEVEQATGLPLPWDLRRNYLPVVELSQRLSALLALNVGLAERLPYLIWRTCPAPIPACRELDDLMLHLDEIEEAARAARSTLLFLWEIAASESARQKEQA